MCVLFCVRQGGELPLLPVSGGRVMVPAEAAVRALDWVFAGARAVARTRIRAGLRVAGADHVDLDYVLGYAVDQVRRPESRLRLLVQAHYWGSIDFFLMPYEAERSSRCHRIVRTTRAGLNSVVMLRRCFQSTRHRNGAHWAQWRICVARRDARLASLFSTLPPAPNHAFNDFDQVRAKLDL